jgi:hypothetical protein
MEEGALLVELFADDVEKCMLVINSALGAGMSWTDIEGFMSMYVYVYMSIYVYICVYMYLYMYIYIYACM